MRLYFKPEWRIPTIVGVSSFAAGIGAGILGVKLKQRRDDNKMMEDLREVVPSLDFNQLQMEFKDAVKDVEMNPRKYIINSPFHSVEGQAGNFHKLELDPSKFKGVVPHQEIFDEGTEDEIDLGEGMQFPVHKPLPGEGWDFEETEPDEDEEVESHEEFRRTKDTPYIISSDEFHGSNTGFRQTELEYFAQDDMLCDEQRVPIYNPHTVVGELEFGKESDDPNVVYVRNEKLGSEWMITRLDESYAHEVLGIQYEEDAEDELKHSNGPRRFKLD